jgi:branched-subunit amino acid aminotransferase/4-amino-4-deoxychorismate lyase
MDGKIKLGTTSNDGRESLLAALGPGDNFFIIKNETIYSPRGRNILSGISRDCIFELCDELKLKYEEKDIEPYDVYRDEETFMIGTPCCMLLVIA